VTEPLSPGEGASLLWEEWKYRHDLFWQAFYRWGTAAVVVSVVPYVQPRLVDDLGSVVLVFPALAALLAVGASWHLFAEYARLLRVTARYREALGVYAPAAVHYPSRLISWVLRWPVGWVVSGVFLVVAPLLSLANGAILVYLLNH
jgi:hypothetical protein